MCKTHGKTGSSTGGPQGLAVAECVHVHSASTLEYHHYEFLNLYGDLACRLFPRVSKIQL
jgi:hypothetical protein